MCHVAVIEFFIENVEKEEFEDKRVLEVGSKYVNGSVRPLIERFCSPKEYVGVDIEPGKFVDLILPAEKLVEYFGPESFDVVIATELLEHIQNWRLVVGNLKGVLKCGGYIYITTRSHGFPFHAYPYDFWRYEIEDMRKIFSDFEVLKLIKDHEAPGVFLKARKPFNYSPNSLRDIALYSMILGKRTTSIPKLQEMSFSMKAGLLTLKMMRRVHSFVLQSASRLFK
jgi:SAM-dependent methyltransferase